MGNYHRNNITQMLCDCVLRTKNTTLNNGLLVLWHSECRCFLILQTRLHLITITV